MDDDAIKAAIRQEARRRLWQNGGLIVVTAGLALLCLPLVILDETKGAARIGLYGLMAAGLTVALVGFAVSVRFMKDANTERVAQRGGYRDRVQREHARYIGFLPVGSLLMTWLSLKSTWTVLAGRGDFHDWAFAVTGPLISLAILQLVAGLGRGQDARTKRALDDELLTSFHQRSLNTGFAVAVMGLVVGFAAGLYDPAWGVMALPIVLASAAAAAAFRYAQLDRQADPNG